MTLDQVSARAALDALAQRVIAQHPCCGILRPLLELRADEPFAAQRLAQAIHLDETASHRIRVGYAQLVHQDRQRPFTARDAIAISGYRPIHCSAVAINIVEAVAGTDLGPRYGRFWWSTYATASFASVIAEIEQTNQDHAFGAAFLRNVMRLLLHRDDPDGSRRALAYAQDTGATMPEAERATFGYSHLDLGPRVAEAWELPPEILPVFSEDGDRHSLAGMFSRARAAAWHHGFVDREDVAPPPEVVAAGEVLIDGYLQYIGGIELWKRAIRGFLTAAGFDLD